MKHLSIISAIAACAVAAAAVSVGAFAQVSEDSARGEYAFEAKRIAYSGELCAYGIDIPADAAFTDIAADEPTERGDNLEWELWCAETETVMLSSAFHQGEGGVSGEIEAWRENGPELGTELITATDADGNEFAIAEFQIDDLSFLIGEYAWGDDTWVNVTACTRNMSEMRDDLIAMLSTFSGEPEPQPASDGVLTEGAPLGEYGMEAKRIGLECGTAELSVDIPAEFAVTNTYCGESLELDFTGRDKRYPLLDAENGDDFMFALLSPCMDFERRKEDLAMLGSDSLEFADDADGVECAIMTACELNGTSFHIIAEYPCGEGWVYTVSFVFEEKPADEQVSEIYAMLKTFSRSAATAPAQEQTDESVSPDETAQPEDTDAATTDEAAADIPATGVGVPVTIVTAAAGLAASAAFKRKR